jgi:hypothetical protein
VSALSGGLLSCSPRLKTPHPLSQDLTCWRCCWLPAADRIRCVIGRLPESSTPRSAVLRMLRQCPRPSPLIAPIACMTAANRWGCGGASRCCLWCSFVALVVRSFVVLLRRACCSEFSGWANRPLSFGAALIARFFYRPLPSPIRGMQYPPPDAGAATVPGVSLLHLC